MADDIDIDIVYSSQNLLCASVVNTSTSFSFFLVCVYGDPHHRRTKDIWSQILRSMLLSPLPLESLFTKWDTSMKSLLQ